MVFYVTRTFYWSHNFLMKLCPTKYSDCDFKFLPIKDLCDHSSGRKSLSDIRRRQIRQIGFSDGWTRGQFISRSHSKWTANIGKVETTSRLVNNLFQRVVKWPKLEKDISDKDQVRRGQVCQSKKGQKMQNNVYFQECPLLGFPILELRPFTKQ